MVCAPFFSRGKLYEESYVFVTAPRARDKIFEFNARPIWNWYNNSRRERTQRPGATVSRHDRASLQGLARIWIGDSIAEMYIHIYRVPSRCGGNSWECDNLGERVRSRWRTLSLRIILARNHSRSKEISALGRFVITRDPHRDEISSWPLRSRKVA